jgi:hypothetical protein
MNLIKYKNQTLQYTVGLPSRKDVMPPKGLVKKSHRPDGIDRLVYFGM